METIPKKTGTKLTDGEFFGSLINTRISGLENIALCANRGDYREARKILADYVRENLEPDIFFSAKQYFLTDHCMADGETDRQAADRICRYKFVVCGMPYQFEDEMDWNHNPTFNEYQQWPVGLNRHYEFCFLAKAYNETGNKKYAECFAGLFGSWVRQAVLPEKDDGSDLIWLTLNAGIRMGITWQYALHSFCRCESFTDDLLTEWYKSVYEHGRWLYENHKGGNWLIMEMNGLAHIGLLYPLFKESQKWLDYAVDKLKKEIGSQIYPDGFQYELTTAYHEVVLYNYFHLGYLLSKYGVAAGFTESLENAVSLYIKLMMPDGRLPNINDGSWDMASDYIIPKLDLYPRRKDFLWAAARGTREKRPKNEAVILPYVYPANFQPPVLETGQGEKPDYESVILPYAGFTVMRNGWEKESAWALFDAGPFGLAHQHEDKLSLLLYANGRLILTEGGIYAYDDSEMREYVLSTRSHNTVRVNGQDQNRRKNYRWNNEDIRKESGMNAVITDAYDMAEGIYDEGYGPEAEKSAAHRRKVIFVKKPEKNLNPFFLVIDRLYSDKNNEYELLWHLDEENVTQNGTEITADNVKIFTANKDLRDSLVKGQETPEFQGFKSNSMRQGDYSPVYALRYTAIGSNVKVATLFYPLYDKECPIMGIETSGAFDDDSIAVLLRDGAILKYTI